MEETSKKCGGRPAGRIKTDKIEILIEPDLKVEYKQICQAKGISASVHLHEYIRHFVEAERGEKK